MRLTRMPKKSATPDPGGVGNGASKGIISEAAEVAKTVSAEVRGGRLDRLALWITERVGTMMFFLVLFTWTVCWLLWNMFAPKAIRFDPFPGFVLWLFISNMIQLFLMPLIMIGQNVQSRHADLRAEADLKINTKAEFEIETILAHLEYQ